MRRSALWIPVVLILLLGGCESLGAVAGGIVGTVGSALTRDSEQKLVERALWREKHRDLGEKVVDTYEEAADQKMASGDVDAAIGYLQRGIEFHETLWPKLLIEKLVGRSLALERTNRAMKAQPAMPNGGTLWGEP